ncbi:MAG TPA: matrixin family metalloprotease [Gemmataceae bacterium]|nr:matrixin family metalloprotease [Gemmataceae bacterium]
MERLDARDMPASFGVPWADSTHLTISFAPDGTSAAGEPTDLAAKFDAQMPGVWRPTILRAAQTWARVANLEIGVVVDGGLPFGEPGATQGDRRFGDIRIGGLAMADDALGEAIPPDPVLSGTMAGDVFFNTSAAFTPELLYRVALHEIGHALGMASSGNPNSVMFNTVGSRDTLSLGDTSAIRALYGAPAADPNEDGHRNDSFKRATRLDADDDGATPLVGFGRIGGGDMDVFEVRAPDGYSGPTTVRVQTAGLSLLNPRAIVYDRNGRELGRVTGTAAEGDTIEFKLASLRDDRFFVRVDAPRDADVRTGRFGIAVTFDDRLQPTALTLEEILTGPYDDLESDDIAELFADPDAALFHEDGGTDDTEADATDLTARAGRFTAMGSLTTPTDVDFYRVRAPKGAGRRVPLVLTVTTQAVGDNGVLPTVEVFDRDMNPLPAEVLRNGNGEYAVQVRGAESDRRFYLRWSGPAAGNFSFEAGFRKAPVPLQDFAADVTSPAAPALYKLYAARTQLFGFTLTAGGPAGSAVRMTITNGAGQTVFDLTAPAGQTHTARSLFLAPGEYDITVAAVGAAGPLDFRLRGAVETDPIGPRPGNTALEPTYPNPSEPGTYLYPNNQVSATSYVIVEV